MTTIALFTSLVMGIAALTFGYMDGGYRYPAMMLVGFGFLWLLAQFRHWTWFSSIGLLVLTGTAAAGLWLELASGWMIVGVLGGLFTWDLSDFARRLRYIPPREDQHDLERFHLARLMVLAALGLLLASGAMIVQLRFTFEWAIFLVLIAVWGISQLVSWLRRGGV